MASGFSVLDASGQIKQTTMRSGMTVISDTSTGSVNDWGPTGLSGDTLIKWNGASDATFTGLAGGISGQLVIIRNITSSKVAYFAHQSGSSSAGNKFKNAVTSAATPIAAGGFIAFLYDGTDWQLVAHSQGAWINVTYSAGDFTGNGSMTWTVDSGDLVSFQYLVVGKSLTVGLQINTSTVGGSVSNVLQVKVPGGFSALSTSYGLGHMAYADGGAFQGGGLFQLNGAATTTLIQCLKRDISNWTLATNATGVSGTVTFEIS